MVSGFGLGVGGHVITGVLKYIYSQGSTLHDQLILRPFPQGDESEKQMENYRQDMVAHAGIAIFMFGNKIRDGKVVLADGVRQEFAIAKAKKLKLIPIGSTGYVAGELWKEMMANFAEYFPQANESLKKDFQSLGDTSDVSTIIGIILKIIDQIKRN